MLTTVPFVPAPELAADASPYRRAEPSLMALIDSRLGNAWQWTVVNADNHDAIVGTIGLGELGLEVSEAIALSYELLNEAARIKLNLPLVYISEARNRQWDALGPLGEVIASGSLVSMRLLPEGLDALDADARRQLICAKLGVPPDSPIQESPVAEPRMWIAKDEHGGLLGMLRVTDIGMPPEDVAKLDDAALRGKRTRSAWAIQRAHRFPQRASPGAADRRLAGQPTGCRPRSSRRCGRAQSHGPRHTHGAQRALYKTVQGM